MNQAEDHRTLEFGLRGRANWLQFTIPSATTVDLSAQWRIRKDLRFAASVVNFTDRKYWMWPDVQGLAASMRVADAYTQPGRHARLSLTMDF